VEAVAVNAPFWNGRRVLLTGHSGFKGSWLSLWLQRLGSEVVGVSRGVPTQPALFEAARVGEGMTSLQGDVLDLEAISALVAEHRPEVVIHMAAQPIVRVGFEDPVGTFATNVMGTAHVLEAVRRAGTARVIVNVTTDKVYENREWEWAYREDEALGGFDPYASSKAGSEIVTNAYRRSFFAPEGVALATARAGNVIGGGDWARDRLIPDLLRGALEREVVRIRNPNAIRPWQHVLNPLSGYLVLAERMWHEPEPHAHGWNFGPDQQDDQPVGWVADRLAALWGEGPAVGARRGRASSRGPLPAPGLLAGQEPAGLGAALGPRTGAGEHRRLRARPGGGRGPARRRARSDRRLRGGPVAGPLGAVGPVTDVELAVFTYNRADRLRRTLEQLAAGPFADRRITVLDNASTDHTPEVCREAAAWLAGLRVVRHARNIGAGANYLRAVELAEAEYLWVLADDDDLDFTDCGDVLDALSAGEVDLISLGAPGQEPWERGLRTTVQALVARGARYFYAYTFVPGVIFRTALVDDRTLAAAYKNVANMYPHFPFVVEWYARDRSVLGSRREIVRRHAPDPGETTGTVMRWLAAWARSCSTIDDPALRRRALRDAVGEGVALWRSVGAAALVGRVEAPERLAGELLDIARAARGADRAAVVAAGPAMLAPRPVLRGLRAAYRRRTGDGAVADAEYDELRV
jgi:CDP-glucose 4,6-dehydratase